MTASHNLGKSAVLCIIVLMTTQYNHFNPFRMAMSNYQYHMNIGNYPYEHVFIVIPSYGPVKYSFSCLDQLLDTHWIISDHFRLLQKC